MQLDGPNQSIHSQSRRSERGREGQRAREREREVSGAEEEKFKACEVKLEGHSLSAFSLPA